MPGNKVNARKRLQLEEDKRLQDMFMARCEKLATAVAESGRQVDSNAIVTLAQVELAKELGQAKYERLVHALMRGHKK